MQHNPAIRLFADRLRERGKPPKVIVGAIMRKLLRIIFAVVKSKQPYSVDYRACANSDTV
jgi:transposase